MPITAEKTPDQPQPMPVNVQRRIQNLLNSGLPRDKEYAKALKSEWLSS